MKTTKITTALSLGLIFLGINLLFAGNPVNSKIFSSNAALVRHQVNIHYDANMKLCNMWAVEITDGAGNLVAPYQVFFPGKTTYSFYEKGRVTGIRVARMVLAPTKHYNCEPEFYVAPDAETGTFLSGETVTFDLSPTIIAPAGPIRD